MNATAIHLREYQREAIEAVTSAWAEGVRRPAIVLATGLGKTVIFSQLASEFIERTGHRVLILVHRDELASQAMDKIRGIAPHLSVGKVKAQDNDVHASVIVASVQTASRSSRLHQVRQSELLTGPVGLVITDECFPAGTLVGGRPIESLKQGDLVPSWNEATGREEERPVVRAMSKRPSSLVRVQMADGSAIVCTPNHPILTDAGWCPAGMLLSGAFVVSFTHDTNAELRQLRSGIHGNPKEEDRRLAPVGSRVLLGHVSGRVGIPEFVGAHGPHESEVRFGQDAGTEPDAFGRDPREGVRHVEADRSQAPVSGWQWETDARGPAHPGRVPGMADGVLCDPPRWGAALPLQGGYRSPDDEGVRGGGRGVPLLAGTPSLRPSQGRTAVLTRVAGVEVLEPGCDGTYGGMCPGGLVYNLEVDSTHTYLIGSGTVVHNCHHSVSPSYAKIYDAFPDAVQLGVTATLARGDGIGLGSVWDDVVYEKSIAWGIKKKFLSPVRGVAVRAPELDLSSVKKSGGDYRSGDLGRALATCGALDVIPKAYLEHAAERSGVVFTPTVETAEYTAEVLREAGITSAVISGATPREERVRIFEDHRTGRVQVLSNCMVLTEGWDSPHTSCIVIARPTQSNPLYCLDSSTEILTDQGWKGVDDPLTNARPAAYDTSDGSVHWSPLLARVERPLADTEQMYALVSPTADIRVSDRHRMVWAKRNESSWTVSEARELAARASEYKIPIAGVQKTAGVPLSDDELRFIGWFMTDGTLDRSNGAISISQAEHQPWNVDIRSCLEGCGFKYRVYRHVGGSNFRKTSDTLRYTVSKGKPRGTDKHLRGWGALEPYLSKELSPELDEMTRDQFAVMLHAMHLGNGAKQAGQTWTRRSYHISTGNKTMADRLQSLCVRRGFKCNLAVGDWNEKPIYILHIKDTDRKSVGGANAKDREHLSVSESAPGERVWCVETDAGTLITRRNGKVAILGNCQMVGRGTRTYPGKADCLVLDIVGAGATNKLMSLVDLEPGMFPDTQPCEVCNRVPCVCPCSGCGGPRPCAACSERPELELVQGKTEEVDLFAGSTQSWLMTKGGVLFIPAGEAGEIVLWASSTPGRWDVVHAPKTGKWIRLHEALPLGTAQAWAESEADDLAGFNVRKTASWRKKRPSEAHLDFATRLRIDLPADVRSGELGNLISVALASKRIDRYLPRV